MFGTLGLLLSVIESWQLHLEFHLHREDIGGNQRPSLSQTWTSNSQLLDPGEFPSDVLNSTCQCLSPLSSPFLSFLLYFVPYLGKCNHHPLGCISQKPGSHSSWMLPCFLILTVIPFLLSLHHRISGYLWYPFSLLYVNSYYPHLGLLHNCNSFLFATLQDWSSYSLRDSVFL